MKIYKFKKNLCSTLLVLGSVIAVTTSMAACVDKPDKKIGYKEGPDSSNQTANPDSLENSSDSRTKIIDGMPSMAPVKAYENSSNSITQANEKVFFIGGTELNLYYFSMEDKKREIFKTPLSSVESVNAFGENVYALTKDQQLLSWNSDEDKVMFQVDLAQNFTESQERYYELVFADAEGAYMQSRYLGEVASEGAAREDYALFFHVSKNGNVEIKKTFPEWNYPGLVLVSESNYYYNLRDKDGNTGIYSWNEENDEIHKISSQNGIANGRIGLEHYIWEDNLIFPIEGEVTGFCVAKLDGSDEKIYPFPADKSYTKIGNTIYSSDEKMQQLNIETGETKLIVEEGSDFKGTLKAFGEKLILTRFEGETQADLEDADMSIYIFSIE